MHYLTKLVNFVCNFHIFRYVIYGPLLLSRDSQKLGVDLFRTRKCVGLDNCIFNSKMLPYNLLKTCQNLNIYLKLLIYLEIVLK